MSLFVPPSNFSADQSACSEDTKVNCVASYPGVKRTNKHITCKKSLNVGTFSFYSLISVIIFSISVSFFCFHFSHHSKVGFLLLSIRLASANPDYQLFTSGCDLSNPRKQCLYFQDATADNPPLGYDALSSYEHSLCDPNQQGFFCHDSCGYGFTCVRDVRLYYPTDASLAEFLNADPPLRCGGYLYSGCVSVCAMYVGEQAASDIHDTPRTTTLICQERNSPSHDDQSKYPTLPSICADSSGTHTWTDPVCAPPLPLPLLSRCDDYSLPLHARVCMANGDTSYVDSITDYPCDGGINCANPCTLGRVCGYQQGAYTAECGGYGRACIDPLCQFGDECVEAVGSDVADPVKCPDIFVNTGGAICKTRLPALGVCISTNSHSRCLDPSLVATPIADSSVDAPCAHQLVCSIAPCSDGTDTGYCGYVNVEKEPWFITNEDETHCGKIKGARCQSPCSDPLTHRCLPSGGATSSDGCANRGGVGYSCQPVFKPFEQCDPDDARRVCLPSSATGITGDDAGFESSCALGYFCTNTYTCSHGPHYKCDMDIEEPQDVGSIRSNTPGCGGWGTVCALINACGARDPTFSDLYYCAHIDNGPPGTVEDGAGCGVGNSDYCKFMTLPVGAICDARTGSICSTTNDRNPPANFDPNLLHLCDASQGFYCWNPCATLVGPEYQCVDDIAPFLGEGGSGAWFTRDMHRLRSDPRFKPCRPEFPRSSCIHRCAAMRLFPTPSPPHGRFWTAYTCTPRGLGGVHDNYPNATLACGSDDYVCDFKGQLGDRCDDGTQHGVMYFCSNNDALTAVDWVDTLPCHEGLCRNPCESGMYPVASPYTAMCMPVDGAKSDWDLRGVSEELMCGGFDGFACGAPCDTSGVSDYGRAMISSCDESAGAPAEGFCEEGSVCTKYLRPLQPCGSGLHSQCLYFAGAQSFPNHEDLSSAPADQQCMKDSYCAKTPCAAIDREDAICVQATLSDTPWFDDYGDTECGGARGVLCLSSCAGNSGSSGARCVFAEYNDPSTSPECLSATNANGGLQCTTVFAPFEPCSYVDATRVCVPIKGRTSLLTSNTSEESRRCPIGYACLSMCPNIGERCESTVHGVASPNYTSTEALCGGRGTRCAPIKRCDDESICVATAGTGYLEDARCGIGAGKFCFKEPVAYGSCNPYVGGRVCVPRLETLNSDIHSSDLACPSDTTCADPCGATYPFTQCVEIDGRNIDMYSDVYVGPATLCTTLDSGNTAGCFQRCGASSPWNSFAPSSYKCYPEGANGQRVRRAAGPRDEMLCGPNLVCDSACGATAVLGASTGGALCFPGSMIGGLHNLTEVGAEGPPIEDCGTFCFRFCERGDCVFSETHSNSVDECGEGQSQVCVGCTDPVSEICVIDSLPHTFGGSNTPCDSDRVGSGFSCKRRCPPGEECLVNQILSSPSSPLCPHSHSCQPATVCPPDELCRDDGIAGTHTVGCPSEQICAPACPIPFFCSNKYEEPGSAIVFPSEVDPFSAGCSGSKKCSTCTTPGFVCRINANSSAVSPDDCGVGYRCQPPCDDDYICVPSTGLSPTTSLGCKAGHVCGERPNTTLVEFETTTTEIATTTTTGLGTFTTDVSAFITAVQPPDPAGPTTAASATAPISTPTTFFSAPTSTTSATPTTLRPATPTPPPDIAQPSVVGSDSALLDLQSRFLTLGPYSSRYPVHDPAPIYGIPSGVPLLFSEGYHWYNCRRFQQLSSSGGKKSPSLVLRQTLRPIDYNAASGSSSVGLSFAFTKTTSTIDAYYYSATGNGRESHDQWSHNEISRLRIDTSDTASLGEIVSATECGALMTGGPLIVIPSVAAGKSLAPRLAVGAISASSARCGKSHIAWSGMAYSTQPFTRSPIVSFTHFYNSATLSEDDAVDSFLYGNISGGGSPPTQPPSLPQTWGGVASKDDFTAMTFSSTSTQQANLFIFQGNASDTKASTKAPAVQRYVALMMPRAEERFSADGEPHTQLVGTSTGVHARAPIIGPDTAFSAGCHSGDMFSYDGTYVAPRSPFVSGGTSMLCYTFSTVDDIHLSCDERSDCIGFTTIRMPSAAGPRELPLCLYVGSSSISLSGQNADDVMVYQRMFYRKPDVSKSPSCNVVVAKSGRIGVSIQQTFLASATVSVRVNGVVVAVCGQERPFANGVMGADGRCNVYTVCYGGSVPAGAHIEISPSSGGLRQSNCENSLGVIVEQTQVDNTQRTAVTEAPIPSLSLPVDTSSRILMHHTSSRETLKVFSYKAVGAALSVRQTGFDCNQYSSKNGGGACPPGRNVLTFSSETSCQYCGGVDGFYGSHAGFSDRCSTFQYCGPFMGLTSNNKNSSRGSDMACGTNSLPLASPTNASMAYTGFISVTVDGALLSYTAGECKGFDGIVYAQPLQRTDLTPASIIPVFPILNTVTNRQEIFLGTPAGTSDSSVALLLGMSRVNISAIIAPFPLVSHSDLQDLTVERMVNIDNNLKTISLHYVNWDLLYQRDYPSALLSPNITLYCLLDHNPYPQKDSRCIFPIPAGSTRLRVSAAQIDFAANEMIVEVFPFGTALPSMAQRSVCGGSFKRFGSKAGEQQQCSSYYSCVSGQYIYPNDSYATGNTLGYVSVILPASLRPRGNCDFAASIAVTFSAPSVSSTNSPTVFNGCNADAEFECPNERRCIPKTSICNGIQDCASNSDEASCGGWLTLPDETFCIPLNATGGIGGGNGTRIYSTPPRTFDDCRRLAVSIGSSIFSITASGVCTVYTPAASVIVLEDPNAYACEALSTDTYFIPPTSDLSSFGLCRSSIQCRGKGTATLIGAECVCICGSGFVGSDCSVQRRLDTFTHMVVSFRLNPSSSTVVHEATVESALTLRSTLVAVSCDDYVPLNGSVTMLACSISGTGTLTLSSDISSHFKRLLSPASISVINDVLSKAGHPIIVGISGRTMMNPVIDMGDCNRSSVSGDGTSFARCGVTENFDKLRFNLFRNVSVRSIRVTIKYPSVSTLRSFLPASTEIEIFDQTATCTPVSTYVSGGCYRSQCDVDISGRSDAIVSVSNVTVNDEDDFTENCLDEKISTSAHVSFGNVATFTNVTSTNVKQDYSPFLIGGIVLFVAGTFVAWTLAFLCGTSYLKERRRFMRTIPWDSLSGIVKTKMEILVDLAFDRERTSEDRWKTDNWCISFSAGGIICGISAAFLVLYFVTGDGVNANFRVMYEEYSDSQCSHSPSSYMPTRIFSVPEGSISCTKMESTGESAGITYATGECRGSHGAYTLTFKMGPSKSQCGASRMVEIPSGTCMPLQDISPSSLRNVYVQLTCSTAALINKRTSELGQLTKNPDVFVRVPVRDPPVASSLNATLPTTTLRGASSLVSSIFNFWGEDEENDHSNPPQITGAVYTVGYLSGSIQRSSTSFYPNTLDSQALPDHFDGDLRPSRIVMQSSACSFDVPNTDSSECLGLVENSLTSLMTNLGETMATKDGLSPNLLDAPIGYIMNGFGTSTYNTWEAAGPQSHKYYGAIGTNFDMGLQFPNNVQELSDDEGYTISMWLRADETTQGFAYAVCDAFEHSVEGTVYPLARLGEIIANGKGGSSWFDETYSVYQSLYVNGPGKSLIFAYASPSFTEEKVHQLEFDLQSIDATRALNGQWHHVAISFLVENGRARAQLTIDGESSYTKNGWSACISEFPVPITEFRETGSVYSKVSDTITSGGMVVTGYFNGGVYNLRMTSEPLLNTDFLSVGTQAMRNNNPFPRLQTLVLGTLLLSLSFVFLAHMVYFGTSSIRKMLNASNQNARKEISESFYFLEELAIKIAATSVDVRNQQRALVIDQTPIVSADPPIIDEAPTTVAPSNNNNSNPEKLTSVAPSNSKSMSLSKSLRAALFLRRIARGTEHSSAPTLSKEELVIIPTPKPSSNPPAPGDHTVGGNSYIPLIPIRITTALRWSNLSVSEFQIVMNEIKSQSRSQDSAASALLLLLYQCKHNDLALTHFTVEEWNSLVNSDAEAERSRLNSWRRWFTNPSDEWIENKWSGQSSDSKTVEHTAGGWVSFSQRFYPGAFNFTGLKNSEGKKYSPNGAHDEGDESNNTRRGGAEEIYHDDIDNAAGDDGFAAAVDFGGDHFGGGNRGGGFGKTAAVSNGDGIRGDDIGGDGDAGKLMGGVGTSASSGMIEGIINIGGPMIAVFQSMYVWSTSIEFPKVYDFYFKDAFSFMSIDFAMSFDELSTLVTPLIQLFVGLAAIPLVFCLMYEDNKRFDRLLAQYVWRRDDIESGSEKNPIAAPILPDKAESPNTDSNDSLKTDRKRISQIAPHLSSALEDPVRPADLLISEVLPISSARQVDLFSGTIKAVRKDDQLADFVGKDFIQVKTMNNSSLLVTRLVDEENTVTDSVHQVPQVHEENSNDASSSVHIPLPSNLQGKSCKHLLASQMNPTGEFNEKDLTTAPLHRVGMKCKRHPDRYLSAQSQTDIWPFTNPPSCCILTDGALCGESLGTIYCCGLKEINPATGQTVVCSYALCEAHSRLSIRDRICCNIAATWRKFRSGGTSWLLCIGIVMAANAVYTPFMKTALMILGCHPFYQCEFDHCWSSMDQKFALAVFCCLSIVVLFGIGFPGFMCYVLIRRKHLMDKTFLAPEYNGMYANGKESEKDAPLALLSPQLISEAEWIRFTTTDITALGQQYGSVYCKWMFYPSIAILFKVLQLIPAIFIEPRTFEQRLGCACVQFLIALFVFCTTTHLSPVVLLTLRAAEVHNLAVLGLQNIALVLLNDRNVDVGVSIVVTTFVYIIFSLLVFIATVAFPIADAVLKKRRLRRFLSDHHLDYVSMISLYTNPFGDQALAATESTPESTPPRPTTHHNENKNATPQNKSQDALPGVLSYYGPPQISTELRPTSVSAPGFIDDAKNKTPNSENI